MSEENGTVRKAGWGCLGCGLGLLLSIFLLIGLTGLALYGLGTVVSGCESSAGIGSGSSCDPDNLEEEYVLGKKDVNRPRIAVVEVRGVIASGEGSFGGVADPEQICTRIRRAAVDSKVKALIVNLNTPGGEVVAADAIYAEIKRFRQQTGKPAVAMMNTMAASGGYYVAAACSPIVANKLTITGSIGVIVSAYNYRGLFEKVGLQSEVYTSGKMKDMLNGARVRTPEEIQVVRKLVDSTYHEFVRIVAESRRIPAEKIRSSEIGDGRVFDGVRAKELGLVDSLGYFRNAVEIAAGKAGLKRDSYMVIRYKEPFSLGRLISLLSSSASGRLPVHVTVNGIPGGRTFVPERGLLYYLPANY